MASTSGSVEYRGNILLGTALGFGIGTFLFVTLRLGFRASRGVFSSSDLSIAIAMALSFTHACIDTVCVTQWGYGYHESDLPPDIRYSRYPLMLSYVNDIIFTLTVLFTKLSLCLIYAGLFKSVDSLTGRVSRFINSATACIVICYYTVAFFLSIFKCSPTSKAWILSEPGKCINNTAFMYSTGCVNIITSLLVIGIPLPVLMQTTSAKNDIAQLLFLVLLGLGDTAVSLARLIVISTFTSESHTDLTWTLIDSTTVASIELNVAIIAACLVVMRPCFKAIFALLPGGKKPPRRYNSTHNSLGSVLATKARPRLREPSRHEDLDTDPMPLNIGVTKTFEIELSGRNLSTDEILQGKVDF